MQTFKQIYKEELDKLIEIFEKRHEFYQHLEGYKFKNGQIPNEYLPDWTAWITDKRQHWRKVPGVWRRIKQTAKKNAENRVKNEKIS